MINRPGADGASRLMLDEDEPMGSLVERALHSEERSLEPSLVDRLAALSSIFGEVVAQGHRVRLVESLTPREREVLKELALGSPNKMIGRALHLSENAVKFHLKNIYRKAGISSRAEAITLASGAGPDIPSGGR